LAFPFFCLTPRRRSSFSRPLRPPLPPENRVVNTIPSVSVGGRHAVAGAGRAEGGRHDRPGDRAVGAHPQRVPGMVI